MAEDDFHMADADMEEFQRLYDEMNNNNPFGELSLSSISPENEGTQGHQDPIKVEKSDPDQNPPPLPDPEPEPESSTLLNKTKIKSAPNPEKLKKRACKKLKIEEKKEIDEVEEVEFGMIFYPTPENESLKVSSADLLYVEPPKLPRSKPFGEYHVRENYSPSMPFLQRLAIMKKEMAMTYSDFIFSSSEIPSFKANDIEEMVHHLEDYGFCIMSFSTYAGLLSYIQTEFKNILGQIASEFLNIHGHQLYGLANGDKSQFLNMFIHHPYIQILLSTLAPTIQSLAQYSTNGAYNTHDWFTSTSFPFVHLDGSTTGTATEEDKNSKKRKGRPIHDMSQGTDLESALYFSPYLNEYWHTLDLAEKHQVPLSSIKYPSVWEHLQLFLALLTSTSQSHSVHIAVGMHKSFDIFMDMIRRNEISVDTGAFQSYPLAEKDSSIGGSSTSGNNSFINPLPVADTFYRISEQCVKKIFGSFMMEVNIPDGSIGIFNPKLALGHSFKSAAITLPLSVWPKPEHVLLAKSQSQKRYTELKTWIVAAPLSSSYTSVANLPLVNATGSYYTSRRSFYRFYGRNIRTYESKETIVALFGHFEKNKPQFSAFNSFMENYVVNGYPTQHDLELFQPGTQEFLKGAFNPKEDFDLLCDQLNQLYLGNESESPRVGIVNYVPVCNKCGLYRNVIVDATMKRMQEDGSLHTFTYESICLDCLQNL